MRSPELAPPAPPLRSGAARDLAALALGSLALCSCSDGVDAAARGASADPPEALATCGLCHAVPEPHVLPRARWRRMVERMAALTRRYELGAPLSGGDVDAVAAWYEAHAPDEHARSAPAYVAPTLGFSAHPFGAPADPHQPLPRIGHLEFVDLDEDGGEDLLVSDIRLDAVTWLRPLGDGRWTEVLLGHVPAPARTAILDGDGDGLPDVAVASLSSMEPTDALIGSVVLLRNDGRGGFQPRTLLAGVARVSDVRAADVDLDGDQDLVVAAFGAYRAGGAYWLEQRGDGSWRPHGIVQRNGLSHVPVADLDLDGRPDVLALVSQEHEELVLYRNLGGGRFGPHLLFKAPQPMFGLSGVDLADLDGDGDLDVALANGDALDYDVFVKPWHGVHWLENLGGLRFRERQIVAFPGAYSVRAADLDLDGDVDIVVTSMLNHWEDPRCQSLIWLENQGAGRFAPQAVDASPTFLVTADAGDLDGDGWPDLVAGGMYLVPGALRVGRVTLWVNHGRPR